MLRGTKAEVVTKILEKIPLKQREKVKEVTLDMAGNMGFLKQLLARSRYLLYKTDTK